MLIVGTALLAMGMAALIFDSVANWHEIEAAATRRATAALDMLESLHSQAMLNRAGNQDGDPVIATLDGTLQQFSRSRAGTRLWLIMGPKMVAYQRARAHADIEPPQDAVDELALASGRAQTARVGHELRLTRPVVMGRGSAAHERCAACHTTEMGIGQEEVIGAYSAAVDLSPAIAFWRSNTLWNIAIGVACLAAVLAIAGTLLRFTILKPLLQLTTATRRLAGGDLDVAVKYKERADEVGTMARSLDVFRTSLLDKQRFETRIAHLARHDAVTGLPNRAALDEHLEHVFARCGTRHRFALICVELSGLKDVHGALGYDAGDRLLKAFSQWWSDRKPEGEFIARMGDSEFTAVKEFEDHSTLLGFLSGLEKWLSTSHDLEIMRVRPGAHIGVAVFPGDAGTKSELMARAEAALQRSKACGGRVACFYQASMDEVVRDRRRLVGDLWGAIDRKEFTLDYQVQKEVKTLNPTGYEALLRWHHPERGSISPAEFIPLAEECGSIIPIGEWVLRTACAEAARWDHGCRIAVNLSPLQLSNELPELVHDALLQCGLVAPRLELEVTESAIIRDKEKAYRILDQIRKLGVEIALDDFGTGYSSLDTLRSFPFSKIKLDRSFVRELTKSASARAIIRAVVAMGHSLNIKVLAEGVETREQLARLRAEGCDEAQGYFLGRPQPSARSRWDTVA